MQTFTFHEIASAGTGYLWPTDTPGDNGIGGVYRVLNFMIGDNLCFHQLPRAGEACRPAIAAQHPWVEDLRENLQSLLNNDERITYMRTVEHDYAPHGYTLIPLSDWERRVKRMKG